jgi:nitrogenase molybdenum-iron protein alpha/beta subunit
MGSVLALLVLMSLGYFGVWQYRAGTAPDKNTAVTATSKGGQDGIPEELFVQVAVDEPAWFRNCGSRLEAFKEVMTVAAVDLNDDGRDEYVVQAADSFYCGSGGCSFYIYRYSSPRFERIGEDFGRYAGSSGTVHHGFRDIVNEVRDYSRNEGGSAESTVTLKYTGNRYVR